MFLTKRIISFKYLNTALYCTTSTHNSFNYRSKFSADDQQKILNVLNESNAEQMSRFDVSQMRIKKLESWKNRKGPFKSIFDILEVEGLGMKNFERLCESIIVNDDGPATFQKFVTTSFKNKRNNFVQPHVSNELMIQSAIGIHLDPTGISWVKLSKTNNTISNWDFYDIKMLPKRMLPNETFNLAMLILEKLPKGDVYIFESSTSVSPGNQKQATALPIMNNIELTSMLLTLINTSNKMDDTSNENTIDNKVYFLRTKLSARLFKMLVGNERVSSSSTVDNLLLHKDDTMPCSRINSDDCIRDYYYSQSPINRNLLGQALLIAITFMDLCIYKNINSLQVLLGPPYLGPNDPSDFAIFSNMNNNPLEFNLNKNKLPASTAGRLEDKDDSSQSPSDKRDRRRTDKRDRRDNDKTRDDSDSNLSNSQEIMPLQNGPGLPTNMWGGMMGVGYPMVGMNMIMDPNMMSMNNYGMIPPMMTPETNMITPESNMLVNPAKEIIHCKSCTLFPPNPNAPPPTTRERPHGCRTVFVGGLPENMTEEIITEVFERCGEITTLRLSKKNFCHIRFVYQQSVDSAIFLSGYRIRIGSNSDPPNTGRLHVDYAQARDDQYEWECRQRQLQREQRHRERMEEERLRPPSPPPVVHYTDHEATSVSEKIKQDDTFTKAVQVVITWLERGDCNKRNANTFYSMIQSTNSHIRRLLNEKTQYEDELQKAKEIMKGRMQGILLQFSQIERLFVAACHKKVWDHFTKAQRKNIEVWKKQSMEIKNVQLDEQPSAERADDEMEVSDEDEQPKKKNRADNSNVEEQTNLKEENINLRCQMEAYKNEVEVIKMELKKELDDKDKQFKLLQQTLQGMQQQLMEAKRKQTEEENKYKELQMKLKNGDSNNKKYNNNNTDKEIVNLDDIDEQTESSSISESNTDIASSVQSHLSDRDARLIGIISAFLNVHPFGAGLDYIWSYVSKLENNLRPSDIELLMSKFPTVFKQELVGIGANIERRWLFNAFNNKVNV